MNSRQLRHGQDSRRPPPLAIRATNLAGQMAANDRLKSDRLTVGRDFADTLVRRFVVSPSNEWATGAGKSDEGVRVAAAKNLTPKRLAIRSSVVKFPLRSQTIYTPSSFMFSANLFL